uniref:Uncharacterized protein n=1 Tax=Cacopsylla melanoneura TaxID=428564 RepID=A0A8D8X1S5_9HEMI
MLKKMTRNWKLLKPPGRRRMVTKKMTLKETTAAFQLISNRTVVILMCWQRTTDANLPRATASLEVERAESRVKAVTNSLVAALLSTLGCDRRIFGFVAPPGLAFVQFYLHRKNLHSQLRAQHLHGRVRRFVFLRYWSRPTGVTYAPM